MLMLGISCSGIFGWVLLDEYQHARNAAYAEVKFYADATAAKISLFMREKETDMQKIGNRPLVKALDPARCDPFMLEYVQMHPELGGFTLRDLAGNVICSMSPNAFNGEQMRAFPWFQRAVQSEGFMIGDAFQRPGNGRWTVTATLPVRDAGGKRVAVAILPIDLVTFSQQLSIAIPSNSVIFTIDREQQVVLRSSDVEKWFGRSLSEGFRKIAQQQRDAFFTESGSLNLPRLFAMVSVPGAEWQVFSGVVEADVMAPYYASLGRTAVVLSGVLLLVMLVGWRIGSSILKPINALAEVAGRQARGESGVKAEVEGPSELATLAGQFNAMLEAHHSDEAKLRESETRFRVLTEMSADWYWQQDEHFRFTHMEGLVPASAERMKASVFNKARWDIAALNLTEAQWEAHRAVLRAHQPFRDFRMQRPEGEGQSRWVSISGDPLFDPAGRFTGYCGVGRNITAEYEAEARRLSLEAQLREAQKMEAIGTLAGGIAHDFNNMLGAILGNTQLAMEDAVDKPMVIESLAEIRKAGLRGRELVRQILSFSRRQPTSRRVVPFAPLARESADLLRATISSQVRIELQLAEDLPQVLADTTQMQQVLVNLATNAAHAMRGGSGKIIISAHSVRFDAQSLPAGLPLQPGRYLRIAVSDTGHGMDEATQAHIFEPFFTTKPVGEGTGLGLAVVHGIVKGHEGEITVTSVPGEGTTFTLYFPEALPAAGGREAAAAEPKAARMPAGEGEHILYLDDDESMLFLVKRLLERSGFKVSAYSDQKACLDAVRAAPGDFVMVVTDYNMPGMSGIGVAEELRRISPALPVILTSGFITDELRVQSHAAGVHDLVFKPNAVEEFCAVLQRLVPGFRRRARGETVVVK